MDYNDYINVYKLIDRVDYLLKYKYFLENDTEANIFNYFSLSDWDYFIDNLDYSYYTNNSYKIIGKIYGCH